MAIPSASQPPRAVDDCVITRLEKATMIATIHKTEFSELFMSYLLTSEQSN